MNEIKHQYDVALSFAGEDRGVARDLAGMLDAKGYSVFFDESERARLWGEDLTVKLEDVYKNLSRFCVMFISQHYARKPWTNHERQAALSRSFREKSAYILPIRLDDTDLPGLPDTLGYIDLRYISISEVFQLLLQKLGRPSTSEDRAVPINKERIRDVLATCYRRAIFSRLHAQMSWEAMFNSIAECRSTLQKTIIHVEPENLQRLVASIIGELDFIERRRNTLLTSFSATDEFQIDGAKLRIIALLLELKEAAGISFQLPISVTEEVFFTEEEANQAPDPKGISPDPWMRFREYKGPNQKGSIKLEHKD